LIQESTLAIEETENSADSPPGSCAWPQTREEFGQLVDRFQDPLVFYAFRFLRNQQEAEDAVQDVLLKTFAKRRAMRHVRQVQPYLYRMVANTCKDRLRKQNPRIVSIEDCREDEMPGVAPSAGDETAAAQELDRVEALLSRLPNRQAEVIRLRVLDDLSFSEAAGILGCSIPTVKSRLRYGLQKLRRILSRKKEREL